MKTNDVNMLKSIANDVRIGIIDATHAAKSGHPGGSLGAADIFTALYFSVMNIDPKEPVKADRDRFVLSKGHNAPALYSVMAHRGFFPVEELLTLRKQGSRLQGHPCMNYLDGIDMSTGSLGQGVSAAAGMALGLKLKNSRARVYTLLGDGEIAEGQCWEAFMFSAHHGLTNLTVIIDVNGLQIDGKTSDVMNSEPLDEKMKAFGFEVYKINGNDMEAVLNTFEDIKKNDEKPSCIIAATTKGKGVSFMENEAGWHGKAPNDDEHEKAINELKGGAK